MSKHTFELHQVDIPNVPGHRDHSRPMEKIDTMVFHRIHVGDPENDDAEALAKFFAEYNKRPSGRLGWMPYSFVIPKKQPGGQVVIVEQACPLWSITPHALAWNERSVGVGVVGDFRKRPPTVKQKAACKWLALRLQDTILPHLRKRNNKVHRDLLVTVHGALTRGTKDPEKLLGGKEECPGPLFAPTWREVKKALASAGKVKV